MSVLTVFPRLIAHDIYRNSRYAPGHPLSIPRVSACLDLITALGWFDPDRYDISPQATPEELARFHDPAYVMDLQRAEAVARQPGAVLDPEIQTRRSLGIDGNPLYPEVFRRPATACGGSLLAADWIASAWRDGAPRAVVHHLAGGTHHGRPERASGFCFLNDPVLGLFRLLDHGVPRIAYVDVDAHHGDAVQDAFAEDDRVFTISVHEQNRWPRSGAVTDRAGGMARNLPVPTGLNDSEFAVLMAEAVLPLVREYQPDCLMIQGGCDGLADDPQARMALSNGVLWQAVADLLDVCPLAIVLGGGGYNPYTVARCWAGYWGIINGYAPPDRLNASSESLLRSLPWDHRRARNAPEHWFTALRDPTRPGPVRSEIHRIIETVLA